jgi:hypothetical protein
MYTGTVIDNLMEMVARAEDHVHEVRPAAAPQREDRLVASHFAYRAHESQPMMIGVA